MEFHLSCIVPEILLSQRMKSRSNSSVQMERKFLKKLEKLPQKTKTRFTDTLVENGAEDWEETLEENLKIKFP